MEAAVTAGRLSRSPCRGIKLPRPTHREEMRLLAPAEVPNSQRRSIRGTEPWCLSARIPGCAGARLRHFGTAESTSFVASSSRGNTDRCPGACGLQGAEVESSRRQVTLPAALVHELRSHIETYGVGRDGLLFRSPMGEVVRRSGWTRRFWHPAVRKSNRRGFHDWRYTHASLLIAEGAHPKLIQERLGHTSIRTTLDLYGHLFSGLDQRRRCLCGARGPSAAQRRRDLTERPTSTSSNPIGTRVFMVGPTGLEPVASSVSGKRSSRTELRAQFGLPDADLEATSGIEPE